MFRILFETTNSSGNITILGFGDHQIIGSSSSNQGNIPLLYANTNRSGDKSPPMARIPSGLAWETGGKNISSDKKYIVFNKSINLAKLIYALKTNLEIFLKNMKTKLISLLFALIVFTGKAQTKDSITLQKNQDKISYKQFIAPIALITAGSLLLNTKLNDDLQSNANRFFGEDFQTSADNYLQFVPVAQIYLGKTFGFKPKNDFQHQTINIIVANAIMGTVVFATKNITQQERPDQSDNLSFPSGHTALAFTNAALLYYEYKDSNLWYASSGFLFATATGILRIANNKHYTSDVLAGAGIGLASGLIVSYWNPLKSVTFGKKKKTTAFVFPQIGSQLGLGALIQFH
jgi:hypothetical protein